MWTRDKVLSSAEKPFGLSDHLLDSGSGRRVSSRLQSEGLIELRTETRTLPAVKDLEGPAFVPHYQAFGFPTHAREVTIKTWHLTDAGRAAWLAGGR